MAYLSAGRGVMIHRQNCGNLSEYRKQPDKWISVAWEAPEGRLFSCEIQVEVNNRMGVLAAVASSIAGAETNIDHVSLDERDVDTSSLKFELQVHDRTHLAKVIRIIRRMPDVLRVSRTLA
jgi:(p)ppGpp synthase/HD superfamily hydrolase